jgi:hypothetical protein
MLTRAEPTGRGGRMVRDLRPLDGGVPTLRFLRESNSSASVFWGAVLFSSVSRARLKPKKASMAHQAQVKVGRRASFRNRFIPTVRCSCRADDVG